MTVAAPVGRPGLAAAEHDAVVRLLGREPNEVELGMFAAMWSEHCAYKHSRPLLATLPSRGPGVLVGPGENAGALDIGDGLAVVFKVESHNHPSAVEPYQGAATGVGGIIRDVVTMGARPIALLNSLHFGPLAPDEGTDAEAATRNRYLFAGVVAGIAGYGNCIGIPDVGGDLSFDESYTANPLVNAMCVGLARHEAITLAGVVEAGSSLLLLGAATGRDGIQGASFASAALGEDRDARRPAVQVANPFLGKLLMEACLEVAATGALVAMQDLGAAGLTCALAEVTARGGLGAEVDLDRVSLREPHLSPYEVLLSESQERMLLVVAAGREAEVIAVCARRGVEATAIGHVVDEPVVRCRSAGEIVCAVPGRALAEEAPRYTRPAAPPVGLAARRAESLAEFAAEPVSAVDLLTLLAAPNVRSRRPIWRQYDHMNGTNTLVAPGAGDAALLRVKGTARALALAIDSPGRLGVLDPRLAGRAAVVEAALNVAASGARPIGVTDCLNLGDPESPTGYWSLAETVAGLGEACRALGLPVVSGNVSLYNETAAGAIMPTPVVGVVGLLDDRRRAVPIRWSSGDEIWLLGEAGLAASDLAASEWAWRAGVRGGRPGFDLAAAARLVALLPVLAERQLLRGAHDVSIGGLAVALARVAIASGIGARVDLAGGEGPTAALFGERAGRVLAAVGQPDGAAVRAAAAAAHVPAVRLGRADGDDLRIGEVTVPLRALAAAHETPFG